MPYRAKPCEFMGRVIESGLYLEKMLGSPALVGLALIKAHFDGSEPMTVQEIARLTKTSEDTVRRRLGDLVAAGRARMVEREGRRLYCINPRTARAVITKMADIGNAVKVPA